MSAGTDLLWKPPQAAKALGITVKTLMGHVKAGELVFVPLGRGEKRPRVAFTPADIQAFIEHRRRRAACQPTSPKTARITTSISNSAGNGFMARRKERVAAKQQQ